MQDPFRLYKWLAECRGDEVWSVEHCRERGVPESVINALCDNYESGLAEQNERLYTDDGSVNQFQGVRDVDLAMWIGRQLGIDVDRIATMHFSSTSIVQAIREAVEEG